MAADSGITAKALIINLWSLVTFCIPIALCVVPDLEVKDVLLGWGVLSAVTLLVPPMGWLKPHPLSDKRWNRR